MMTNVSANDRVDQAALARCLFEDSSHALFVFDSTNFCIEDVNPRAESMTQRSRQELLGMGLSELFVTQYATHFRNFVTACHMERSNFAANTLNLMRAQDKPLTVTVSVKRLDDKYEVLMVQRIVENVAREVPRDGVDVYQRLIEHAPLCIHGIDLSGKVSFVNPAGLRMMSLTDADEIVGKPYLDIVENDQRNRVAALMESAFQGEPATFEFSGCVNGQRRWFTSTFIPVFGEFGAVSSLMGTSQDVTEEKNARRELHESEEKLRAIFEQAAVGVAMVEIESGAFATLNQKFMDLLAIDADDAPHSTLLDSIHADDVSRFRKQLSRLSDQQLPEFDIEVRLAQSCGRLIWARLTVSTTWGEDDDPRFHIVVIENITDRKRTEYELERSQIALENAQSRACMGSWEFYADPPRSKWSKEMYTLYYRDPDEGAPQTVEQFLEMVHPEDRENVLARHHVIWHTDQPIESMDVRTNPDRGPVRWLDTSMDRIPDNHSKQGFHVVGTVLDITDRKTAETALRESEQRYRTLVQKAPEAIVILDVETGKFVDFNDNSLKLLKCDGASLLNLTVGDVSPEFQPDGVRSSDAARAHIDSAMAGELPIFDWVHRDALGNEFPCEIRLQRLTVCSREFVRGTVIDMTERKKAEKQLRMTRFAVDHNYGAIIQINSTGSLTYVNESACRLLGYSREELLGLDIWQVDPSWPAESWPERWQRFKRDLSSTFESTYRKKDGGSFPVKVTADYFKIDDEEFVFAFSLDISEHKFAEQTLREQESRLAHVARLSTMGEMVAGIAHELNQPLYSITNFSKAIGNTFPSPLPEELMPIVRWNEQIGGEATRAGKIIKRMRGFVQRGTTSSPTDLHATLDEALELVRHASNRAEISVESQLPLPGPVVRVDHIQIQQVLVNLIVNAIEAIEQHDCEVRQIFVNSSIHHDHVQVSVADTGPGLPPESERCMFNAFETTKPGGLGMGLAISRTIVETFGGSLGVNSNEHGGATFFFTLPLAESRTRDDS